MSQAQFQRMAGLGRVFGGLGLAGYLGYNSLFSVDGGHRGVVFNRVFGVKDEVYAEGTHFMIPWLEYPEIFDVRTKPTELTSFSGTKDLQYVNISLRVLYRPIVDRLPEIWRRLGPDYDRRVLPSLINETLKAVVANYTAEQLTTQREDVSTRIKRDLAECSLDFQIQIQDCAITHLDFSKEFAKAVEDKQIAQQEAERARFLVTMAEQTKKSKIIAATGEARAAELIGDAMRKNPVFAELRRIDAARDIAHVLASGQNRVFLNSDSLLVNLMSDFVTLPNTQ